MDGILKIVDVESSSKVIAGLLEKYRSASGSIIHVQHKTPEGAPLFTPDTPLADEFDALVAKGDEPVIWKQAPGSFTGTDLHEQIKATGKNKVVITGYMAHGCCLMTSRQSAELGLDTIVVRDAIGDRDIPGANHQQLIDTMLAGFEDMWGTVLSSKDIA